MQLRILLKAISHDLLASLQRKGQQRDNIVRKDAIETTTHTRTDWSTPMTAKNGKGDMDTGQSQASICMSSIHV
jgi:hypothetical protein